MIFETVAQLKLATLTAGQLVSTKGYYASGDGGAADYIVAATQAVDGYGDHALAGGTVALLQAGSLANVKQYGAKGDGATDDSASLQAACSAGGVVYIPESTYLVKDIDLSGAFLQGAGSRSILKDNGSATFTYVDTTTGATEMRDITLDGNSGTIKCAEYSNNTSAVYSNVNIQNYDGRCVFFEQGTSNVQVTGGTCENLGGEAYVVKGLISRFVGIHFGSNTGHAIRFGRFNGEANIPSGHYSVVEACTFKDVLNNPVLWEINAGNGVIANCIATGCRGLYKVDSSTSDGGDAAFNVTAIGNRVSEMYSIPAGTTTTCFDGDESATQMIIGNFCDGGADAVNCGSSSIVQGNTILNVTAYGIRAVGDECVIEGNIIGSADIGIYTDGAKNKVHNNQVGPCPNRGISMTGGAYNSVVGNTLDGSGYNIRLVSTATQTLVNSNISLNPVTAHISDSSSTAVTTGNIGF